MRIARDGFLDVLRVIPKEEYEELFGVEQSYTEEGKRNSWLRFYYKLLTRHKKRVSPELQAVSHVFTDSHLQMRAKLEQFQHPTVEQLLYENDITVEPYIYETDHALAVREFYELVDRIKKESA